MQNQIELPICRELLGFCGLKPIVSQQRPVLTDTRDRGPQGTTLSYISGSGAVTKGTPPMTETEFPASQAWQGHKIRVMVIWFRKTCHAFHTQVCGIRLKAHGRNFSFWSVLFIIILEGLVHCITQIGI